MAVSAPLMLYSACTCALMAMTLAPVMPTNMTELFVFVLSSPLNALVTFNFIFMTSVVMAQITSSIVFGTLSDEEMAIVKESARSFIMFKSVYVFSALHAAQYTDLIIWITCFLFFGWLRAFVALAYHRLSHLDYQQPELNQNRKALISFIILCLVVNISFMALSIIVFLAAGWRPLTLLLHEGGLTVIACICSIILYAFQVMDSMSPADHSQKAFYLDSAAEIIIQTVSLLVLLQVWAAYGLSLTVVDMFFFMIVRAVYVRISTRIASLIAYRRVLNDINTRFADATQQELESLDDHCAICHEQLQLGATKKLPCSHFFHLPCLRQWMKYRRTCPVCRSDLLNRDGYRPAGPNMPGPNQWGLRRLFHFNTGNWASWMPNISFEVVRGVHVAPVRRGAAAQLPAVRILSEMFPNVPDEVLQRYLDQAHGIIPVAIESFVNDNSGIGNFMNNDSNGVENAPDTVERGIDNPEPPERFNAGHPSNQQSVDDVSLGSVEFTTAESNGSLNDDAVGSHQSPSPSSEPLHQTDIQTPNEIPSNLRRRAPRSSADMDERRMAAIARIESLARGR